MSWHSYKAKAIGAVVACLVCAGMVATTAAAGSKKVATTTLSLAGGEPTPNIGYVTFYVAQEQGYFKQQHVKIAIDYTTGAPQAAQLVSAGKADLGDIGYEPVIAGYSQGLKGKFIFEMDDEATYNFQTLPTSPITNLGELSGKSVGVSSEASSAIPVGKIILKLDGVDPNSVQFVPVGVGPSAEAALKGGQVVALALWTAAYADLATSGLQLRELPDPLKGQGGSGVYASTKALRTKSTALEGFDRAMAEATAFTQAHPDAAVKDYWKVDPEASKSLGLAQSVQQVKIIMADRVTAPYGKVNMGALRSYIKLYSKETGVAAPPTATEMATNQFNKYANDFNVKAIKASVATR